MINISRIINCEDNIFIGGGGDDRHGRRRGSDEVVDGTFY